MADRVKKKITSKKHLARVEREALQKKYILIGTIAIISIVVILIGIGIVTEGVIKPQKPVAQVNDTKITTEEFQSRVRFQRYNLVNQYSNYYQFIQQLGDPSAFSYFQTTLMQIQNQLQPEFIGYQSIENLIEDELIREDAKRLGIEVSQEEVEKEIAETVFQYYKDGNPTPNPDLAPLPTSTLSPLQMTLVSPVGGDSAAVPETLGDENNLEPTPFSPTPTVYTEVAYKDDYKLFVENFKLFAKISEKDIFKVFESQLLRQKLLDAVVPEVATEEEKVWAHHILFSDKETGQAQAQELVERLASGENFKAVAEEIAAANRTDEAITVRYEDLGWFGKGMMVAPFEEAAYNLEIGEISQPVETSFGWHVIQVIGREVQPLDEAAIEQLRLTAFNEYLAGLRAEAQVDITPDWIGVVPTDPDIPDSMRLELPELSPETPLE